MPPLLWKKALESFHSFITSGCFWLGDITTDCIFPSTPLELRAAAGCVKGWLAPLMLLHVCIIDCERTVVDWLAVFKKENVQLVHAHHYSTRFIIERLNLPSLHAALRLALEWKCGLQLILNLSQFCDFFRFVIHLRARNKATMSNMRAHLTSPLLQLNKATGVERWSFIQLRRCTHCFCLFKSWHGWMLLVCAACQAHLTAQWSASHGWSEHVGSFLSGTKEIERHLVVGFLLRNTRTHGPLRMCRVTGHRDTPARTRLDGEELHEARCHPSQSSVSVVKKTSFFISLIEMHLKCAMRWDEMKWDPMLGKFVIASESESLEKTIKLLIQANYI